RAGDRGDQLRAGRVRDVPDHRAVVVALDDIVAREGEVGIGDAEEAFRRAGRGDHSHTAGGDAGVEEAGGEADARVILETRAGRSTQLAGGRSGLDRLLGAGHDDNRG